jgi:polysaccharide deacetylase 2 family uncharacterized protein YibQ
MTARRHRPYPLRRALRRWRRAWDRYRASASREALIVFVVLGSAAAIGFGVAQLWLPHSPQWAERMEAASVAPAAGPAARDETPPAPADLDNAKWETPAAAPVETPAAQTIKQRPAPAPGLSAEPAWRKFAAAAPDPQGRPMIAVVIDDMGVDKRRSAAAITLPRPVTLAFLPYAAGVAAQARAARIAGHEILVHMPMEAQDGTRDPGPNALLTEIGDDELLRRLRWNLDQFQGYVGVNNHMGSRFTRDRRAMGLMMGELKDRGLLYLDSRTVAESLGPELARESGVPFAGRQVFLDNVQSADGVEARLAEAERIARHNGYAIAIGHPHDATLAALREWLPRAEGEGFVLVPVSAIVRHNWAMERSTARQPG